MVTGTHQHSCERDLMRQSNDSHIFVAFSMRCRMEATILTGGSLVHVSCSSELRHLPRPPRRQQPCPQVENLWRWTV